MPPGFQVSDNLTERIGGGFLDDIRQVKQTRSIFGAAQLPPSG